MALLSPGIQIFESSVTPSTAVAPAENGVATLGFAKKGPINKLTRVRSVSEFAEVFGDPIDPQFYAHILAQSVLANGTDVYFMRIADKDTVKYAQCPVISSFKVEGVNMALKSPVVDVEDGIKIPAVSGYYITLWNSDTAERPGDLYLRVRIGTSTTIASKAGALVKANYTTSFNGVGKGTAKGILYISTLEVCEALKQVYGDEYNFATVNDEDGNEIGIVVSAKNETSFTSSAAPAVIESTIGSYSSGVGSAWNYISDSLSGTESVPGGTPVTTQSVVHTVTVVTTGTFGGITLRDKSTLLSFDTSLATYDRFNLIAKYPGSDMNGVKVVKTSVKSSVDPTKETWTVSVYDKNSPQPIEARTGITSDNFLSEMSKFAYIDIINPELGSTEPQVWNWEDGTWELGVGNILPSGTSWAPVGSGYEGDVYVVEEGNDGWPSINVGGIEQYSETKAINLYVEALGNDDFVNTDEFNFSILATPGTQATLVQNAAINVCTTRGDAIYLADIPRHYCEDKNGIDEAVAWANGNSAFQSSYCAIYYGWFAQTNPYDTDNSIMCPASCFIAPKMVALDQSMGEFYAPAGITRGGLICSDWTYSPDQKDRDKLVGNDNVINPIYYSSTRGVTIMAQKTTDRTTSPLNRVGIRRMTNAIKRSLRSQLVALLFEPNNEVARARARSIVDDIMSGLRTRECVESYDIDVVSGTGANRNDLNVYLSYAPYGLIEKIYVYLSITDAGIEVTEAVA